MDFPNYPKYVALIAQQNLWALIVFCAAFVLVSCFVYAKLKHPAWLRFMRPIAVALFFVTMALQLKGF